MILQSEHVGTIFTNPRPQWCISIFKKTSYKRSQCPQLIYYIYDNTYHTFYINIIICLFDVFSFLQYQIHISSSMVSGAL